jgi:hypothetical protein
MKYEHGALVQWYWQGKIKVLDEKPKIPHGLAWRAAILNTATTKTNTELLTNNVTLKSLFKVCKKWPIHCIFSPMVRQPLGGLGRLIVRGFTITLRHTHTLGRTPLDEWPARRRDLYLTTHNTHKRQTSMPPVRFFFLIPGFSPLIHLYCWSPFCPACHLCFMLSSIHLTQHKHPCPRWDFSF